jgi:putative glycosyltransferase
MPSWRANEGNAVNEQQPRVESAVSTTTADIPMVRRPALSIVTSLYKSEPYVEEFHRRITQTVGALKIPSYEVVYVNDGSPDRAKDLVIKLVGLDPRVILVDLSRNFGHHKALLAGLAYAKGERIFLLESDLEEDPELLARLTEEMDRCGCDVVYAMQKTRRGGWFERTSGHLFYWIMNAISGIDFPKNLLTLRLMTRRYVDSLLLYREREVLLNGVAYLTGYDHAIIPVAKHRRHGSTHSFAERLRLVFISAISFSDRPLKWIFYTGFGVTFFAFAYSAFILARYLFSGIGVSGFTSIVISIWMIGGLNFLFLGIIGIYVATIFSETKQRPNAIVRAVYGNMPAATARGTVALASEDNGPIATQTA